MRAGQTRKAGRGVPTLQRTTDNKYPGTSVIAVRRYTGVRGILPSMFRVYCDGVQTVSCDLEDSCDERHPAALVLPRFAPP